MDPQSAARLVSALDAELGRRWKRRRDTAEAAWRAEADADPEMLEARTAVERAQSAATAAQSAVHEADEDDAAPAEAELAKAEAAVGAAQRRLSAARSSTAVWRSVLVLARMMDWYADNPPPVGAISEPADQAAKDERDRVESWIAEQGGLFAVLRQITQRAERLVSRDEAEAAGAPRPPPLIYTPRQAPSPHGLQREPGAPSAKAKGENSKSVKLSRTDKWRAEQEAQAAARQALLPPRPPAQTEIGWHRGVVQSFDQRLALGVVRFSGMAGFTEASLAPGAFRGSGLTVLIPNQQVDCKLVRRLDGSVFVEDIRLSSGADPQSSAAEQAAADADRVQMQLVRKKWMR
jgi:hypothetical protein